MGIPESQINEKEYFINTRRKLEYTDHYNYERKLKSQIRKIKEMDVPNENMEKILEYHREHSANVKVGTEFKVMNQLYRILKGYKIPFSRTSRKDVAGIVNRINGSGFSQTTANDMKNTLKRFFVWMGKSKEAGWIRGRGKFRIEAYFSIDDVERFLNSCESVEERCFFALMWELGCRVGEILNIRFRDVTFDNGKAMIKVSGKKGERIIPLFPYGRLYPLGTYELFRSHVRKLAKNHKMKDRVWSMVSYNQVQYRCSKIKRKAGLPQLHLHLFRKSRATYLDEHGFTFIQTCRFGGWEIGSRVLQTYILGTGRDLVNAISKLN